MAFPFLVLARSHHLIGRPGPLTENFSDSGYLLCLSLSFFRYFPFFSFHAHPWVAAFFESSAAIRYPVRGFIFQGLSLLAVKNRFLTDCRSDPIVLGSSECSFLRAARLAISHALSHSVKRPKTHRYTAFSAHSTLLPRRFNPFWSCWYFPSFHIHTKDTYYERTY